MKDIELIREAADILGLFSTAQKNAEELRALADRLEAQVKLHCIYVASSKNGRVKWTSDSRRGESWLAGVETGEYTYARRYYAEFAQILRTNYATAEKSSDAASEGEYKNLYLAAIRDLAAINERLKLDPDDGGAVPIIDAIDEMERDLQDCLRSMADAASRIAELEADNARLIREMLVLSVDHEAQLAEYKADAGRYRWLKAQPNRWMLEYMKRTRPLGESLSAAIDAAIVKCREGK